MKHDVAPGGYVGRSVPRREDRRLLLGRGQFVADLKLPDTLHAVFVRSQVAHARIRSVDLSRAATAPGVAYVLNGAELAQLVPPVPDAQLSLPRKWTAQVQHTFLNPQQPLLAYDKVRHVGEAVAVILAESRYRRGRRGRAGHRGFRTAAGHRGSGSGAASLALRCCTTDTAPT